jgi:hypothetical protein
MINVGGFDRDGVPFSACSVQLIQDGDALPDVTAYAEWMPYQKLVAKGEITPTLHEVK